jgi:hypothetical protein
VLKRSHIDGMNEASAVHSILECSCTPQLAGRVDEATILSALALSLSIKGHPSIILAIAVFVELDAVARW